MYRFALRPRWIASHLFVLVLVVTMVNLGLWQLRRLDEKQAQNRVVAAQMAEPVADLGEVLTADSPPGQAQGVEFRRVRASGRFQSDDQVLVRGRSLDSSPGSWVLAPLRMDDGTIVVVNRGWISNNGRFDSVPTAYAAPSGPVTVTGLLSLSQTRGAFGATDPPTGRLANLARVDVARYAKQLDGPVVPAWIQQTSITPPPAADDTVPTVLAPPELDEGPHFSYAAQWFIFTTIAVVGYVLILRRNARERAGGPDSDGDDVSFEGNGAAADAVPIHHEAAVSRSGTGPGDVADPA